MEGDGEQWTGGERQRGRRNDGFTVVHALLVIVLTVLAFFAGRWHSRPVEVEDKPQSLNEATAMLSTAQAAPDKTWTREQDLAFYRHLGQLSPQTRERLSANLANLVNTGKLKPAYPDIKVCTKPDPPCWETQQADPAAAKAGAASGAMQAP